jgi:S-adenosylmethionine synthetase
VGTLPWLQPDAKSQVSFRYEEGWPVAVEAVVLSTQHTEDVDTDTLGAAVQSEIIAVIPHELRASSYRELINPSGRFVTGGPKGDTWLTGRKIIVDT